MSTKITYKIPEKKVKTLGELSPGQVFYYIDSANRNLFIVRESNCTRDAVAVVNLMTGRAPIHNAHEPVQVVDLDITVSINNA